LFPGAARSAASAAAAAEPSFSPPATLLLQEQGQGPVVSALLCVAQRFIRSGEKARDAGNRDDDASIKETSEDDSLYSEDCCSDSDQVGGVGQDQDQDQGEEQEQDEGHW
jgi:hypothetical protein